MRFCFVLNYFFLIFPYNSHAQASSFAEKFTQGKNYFVFNETKLALPIFQDLYKQQPNNSNVNYLLGICYTEEEPNSSKSIFHLERAIKDISTDYDASSFSEKRTPIFVFYYLVIAYSQNGKCKEARQSKNYFHTLYGIEKNDYYVSDAEKWVKKCDEKKSSGFYPNPLTDSSQTLITKTIDYSTISTLFGIQVGAFSRLVPVYEFTGLKNVDAFIDKTGTVRYVIGNFALKSQAESLLKTIREAGYKDAFIVDVNKEKRFSEELVIVNNTSFYNNNIENVCFKVQLGAFRETIPEELAKIFLKMDGIEERNENNFTILTMGNFKTYEEAEKLKSKISELGIIDAFIVAFSNNNKIDLNIARNSYKKKM